MLVGDHLLVDQLAYGPKLPFTSLHLPRLRTVRRGDVVSFHPPGKIDEVYLKRVVAVGGDQVQIIEGTVYVNSARVAEPYAQRICADCSSAPLRIVVPKGQIFVLGDNRDRSEDSRAWGTVPEENVIGEPVLVLWSFAIPTEKWAHGVTASVYLDHPIEHLRWSRFLHSL